MEKIQSAIAKARAARSAQPEDRDPQDGAAAASPVAAPGLSPPSPEAGPLAGKGSAGQKGATAPVLETASWTALPVFVPNAAHLTRGRIVALDAKAPEAVTFDVMRTRILQQMRANNWRRLAITSPGPGCGKTMIALNLGFSLARQPDLRTLVVELDLRRPTMARTLGLRSPQTVAGVLEGTARFEDNAVRHGETLIFATNSASVRNPAEVLGSARTAAALAEIEARYAPSLMLFDMPPMLVGDDVMAFMGQVDAVLLVAAAEATTIREIDTCERDLATQTNVMGVILNKCRYMEKGYGYGTYG